MTVQRHDFVCKDTHDTARRQLGDRRHAIRHRTVLQPARHVGQYSQQLCIVKNISRTGMLARNFGKVETREKRLVEFRGGRSILGRVAWTKDDLAGFEFIEKIDPDKIFKPPHLSLVARPPRLEVKTTARLESEHIMTMVPLLDISQTGAKIECPDIARLGSSLVLHVDNLARMPATVRWWSDSEMGLGFENTIPLPTLGEWASQKRPRKSLVDYCLTQIRPPSSATLDEDWQELCDQIDMLTGTETATS